MMGIALSKGVEKTRNFSILAVLLAVYIHASPTLPAEYRLKLNMNDGSTNFALLEMKLIKLYGL